MTAAISSAWAARPIGIDRERRGLLLLREPAPLAGRVGGTHGKPYFSFEMRVDLPSQKSEVNKSFHNLLVVS
jgi:hypothetical protein